MPGNPLVRFDEGRGGRTHRVAFSPTLPYLARNPNANLVRHRPLRQRFAFALQTSILGAWKA